MKNKDLSLLLLNGILIIIWFYKIHYDIILNKIVWYHFFSRTDNIHKTLIFTAFTKPFEQTFPSNWMFSNWQN